MRLRPPSSKACIVALALVESALSAAPTWEPIPFVLDPVSPMLGWSGLWKTAFGGVTDPSLGQVGWGPSQRVLDTAEIPPGAMGNLSFNSLVIGPAFRGTDLRVYGGRSPPPPDGAAIFSALVNSSTPTTGVQAPGKNGSAISIDLPWASNYVNIFASGGDGIYAIDAIGFTMQIATNYSSVDQIPRVTENFITDGALNPRLRWVNHTTNTSASWKVLKGVTDTMHAMAGSPTAASTAPVSSPSKDSGPEDYWQAISPDHETRCDIPVPDGASFVIVNGTTGPNRATLQVDILPLPPTTRGPAGWENDSDSNTESFHSANNTWAADAILFMRELDPTVRYTVSLQPDSLGTASGGELGIHSITYLYGLDPNSDSPVPPPSRPRGKSNTAAIAGGVVGGVVGGLLIALVALYFCIWQPRKRREREEAERAANIENSHFTPFTQEVDGDAHNNTVPPSYNPAWARQFPREPSAPHTNRDSNARILEHASEKQLYAGGSGPSTPTPTPTPPAVPDWKRPYLPESHGGVPLGAAAPAALSGRRGLFGKKSSGTSSPKQTSEKTSSHSDGKAGQNLQGGYSESMLRAANPDA